jgi:O-acetyl-ADP-ribose deacetylase (regulator of RNase III)
VKKKVGRTTVSLAAGDLTRQEVDAVVNAANSSLMGGGGVDGAIHRAGGPAILDNCRNIVSRIGRLETGKAVITTGGDMPARFVIHTVGPVWHGGGRGEPELLADAYRSSLALAEKEGLKTVAFPGISTGVYGYPIAAAAQVALTTIGEYLEKGSELEEVRIILFGAAAVAAWEEAFAG